VSVQDLTDGPAAVAGPVKASLIIQRIDHQCIAGLGTGDQVMIISQLIGCEQAFNNHDDESLLQSPADATGKGSDRRGGSGMNDPPAALAAAYLRASYRVESLEGPFTLRIGEYCAALQRWHEQLGVDCSAFISAANPFSVPTDDKQNAAAHERLLKRLATAGLSAVPGMGLDPNGQWVPERSMLVAGIPVAEALRLAASFNQYAIVFANADAVPRLCWTEAPSAG